MTDNTLVVKIGGSTLGSHDTTLEDVAELARRGWRPVVVHGGGKAVTTWLEKQGAPTRFVRGLRVTDPRSLEVAVAVMAGLINKELVAGITAAGAAAVGLCGADGRLLTGRVTDPELGRVGQAVAVDTHLLETLTDAGFVPVVAPIALDRDSPGLLNVNADTVAGAIAVALQAQRLVFLTDVPGLLDGEGRLLERIDGTGIADLVASGVAAGGMLPKLEACLAAARTGAAGLMVDGRVRHALLLAVDQPGSVGTRVLP